MYVICRDCKKPAEVLKLKKGEGHYTKSLKEGCQCGTDQRRGKVRQAWLSANMTSSIQELHNQPQKKKESEVVEKKPKPKNKKTSKLWWLLLPLVGAGLLSAKLLSRGKTQ